MTSFYVYMLCRPDFKDPIHTEKAQPFYIGKGKGGRAEEHRRKAKRYYGKRGGKTKRIKVIHELWNKGLDFTTVIVRKNLTERKALDIEKVLIKKYGRIDNETGILTNRTDGGEGISGFKWDEKSKLKFSIRNKGVGLGRRLSEETKLKMSLAKKGKPHLWCKGVPRTEEVKAKIAKGKLGKTIVSNETKRKLSESHKGQIPYNKGKPMPEEQRLKLKEVWRVRKLKIKELEL